MPKITTEIASGNQVSRSSQNGRTADSATRVFRIVLNQPGESFNIEDECGIRIGDKHPAAEARCTTIEGRYDGESRMVYLVTFQYTTEAGSTQDTDPKSQPPNIRPANWSTSTSLIEKPVWGWFGRINQNSWGPRIAATNPVYDSYDGVSKLVPVVTINVTQFDATDPTEHLQLAGSVNSVQQVLGNLVMEPGTLMFRGVSYEPTNESWGGEFFRGWRATYEFAYKANTTSVYPANGTGANPGQPVDLDIGWDIEVPLSGLNCRAFDPAAARADEDEFGQPLKHGEEGTQDAGRIVGPPYELPDGIAPGDRVRAHVKVYSPRGRGASQAPSASPIALNFDGTPRLPNVITVAYRTQPAINLFQRLGIRLI